MKIISWNVNGIRACLKKGFEEFLYHHSPDIMCIQETKAHKDQVDLMMKYFLICLILPCLLSGCTVSETPQKKGQLALHLHSIAS